MSLPKKELVILEAVSGLLSHKAQLGLHNKDDDEVAHTSQFRWEGIDDAFALKVSDLTFYESVTSAFFQVHSYKYIDNPTFKLSFITELKNRVVPEHEIKAAVNAYESLLTELSEKKPSEKDAGWNPNLKEVMDATRNADNREPSKEPPFTGGGPWAESDESFVELMITEGVIGKDNAQLAIKFKRLRDMKFDTARPYLIQLVNESTSAGLSGFTSKVEAYIDANDNKTISELQDRNFELGRKIDHGQFGHNVGFTDDLDAGAYDSVCALCDKRFIYDSDIPTSGDKPDDICPACWNELVAERPIDSDIDPTVDPYTDMPGLSDEDFTA